MKRKRPLGHVVNPAIKRGLTIQVITEMIKEYDIKNVSFERTKHGLWVSGICHKAEADKFHDALFGAEQLAMMGELKP